MAKLSLGIVGCRTKKIIKYRHNFYILTKRSVHQEAISILNVFIPNNRAAKYVKLNNYRIEKNNRHSHNWRL